MPTVSGRLQFDAGRTATSAPSNFGIQGVPIVLQDLSDPSATQALAAVLLTSGNGGFEFDNVPTGKYQMVEAWGTPTTYTTTVDWSSATMRPMLNGGTTPPISLVAPQAPASATHLDCTIRNTFLITVGADNVTQDFLNGPVEYTPLAQTMDSGVVVDPTNLITVANNGNFGFFSPGTIANTGAGTYPAHPYPEIDSQFGYVEPNASVVTPNDGYYTVQNIMNNSHSNVVGTWWRIADHTTGNETGRMMVINGTLINGQPLLIGEATVAVARNTYYLSSWWILNLAKTTGLAVPAFRVDILDQSGAVLYTHDLGQDILTNLDCPEWKQIGTGLFSGDNDQITIRFISTGPAATGNDYALDDVALNEIQIPEYTPVKSVDKNDVSVGDIVTFTVELSNPTGNNSFTDVVVFDRIPDGLELVQDSVVVNQTPVPGADPNVGFSVPDIAGGDTLVVTFQAKAVSVPATNPIINTADVNYSYTPIEGGIPGTFTVTSNPVEVLVAEAPTLNVTKAGCGYATVGGTIYYTVTIQNPSDYYATQVLVTDNLPAELEGVKYSLDGGEVWQDWTGTLAIDPIEPGGGGTILFRGTVTGGVGTTISNTATVGVTFCRAVQKEE